MILLLVLLQDVPSRTTLISVTTFSTISTSTPPLELSGEVLVIAACNLDYHLMHLDKLGLKVGDGGFDTTSYGGAGPEVCLCTKVL